MTILKLQHRKKYIHVAQLNNYVLYLWKLSTAFAENNCEYTQNNAVSN